MTLPGKLTIGFLQEDNPQKFYFRVRPLLTQDEGGYHPTENVKEDYQEDGFIRIVPDKNELSHFKNRMRTLGRYCAIDLRKHPGENDKIRPNKNHNGENGDKNAYIVYSDVIAAVEPMRMAEVVDVDEDGLFAKPGTKLAALRHEGVLKGVYQWTERGEQGAYIVGENLAAQPLTDDSLISMTLPDGTPVLLMMDLGRFGVVIPEAAAPAEEPQPARAEPVQAPRPEPRREEPAPRAAEPAPAPARAEEPKPEKEPAPKAREDKPWLQSTTYVFPRVVAAKGSSPREQSLAQQSGFNPRRGMSMKDIIDDLWRTSRFDQLGHPVTGDTTAKPVLSPVEEAINAFKEAWSLPEARGSLIAALLKLDQLDDALGASGSPDAAQNRARNAGEQQMVRLESDRLKLLGEIDELKRFRQEKRTELLTELRRTHSAEFDKTEKRTQEMQAAQQKYAEQAEQARKAAETATHKFVQQLSGQIDQKMTEHLLSGRAIDMLTALSRRNCAPAARPETEEMAAGELISAVRVRFGEAGIPLSNDEAVNLLACIALGRIMIISGPTGCGKSGYARTLAAALGIAGVNTDCYAEVQAQAGWRNLGEAIESGSASGVPQVRMPEVKRMLENDDLSTPTMLFIDAANRGAMDEYLGELLTLGEAGAPGLLTTGAGAIHMSDSLRLVMTVQDSGSAMSGELLDRAWLMRLAPDAADAEWPPKSGTLPRPEKAVSLSTLKKIFAPGAELPGEITERMRALREKLAANGMYLSRRTLADLYNYCSAVLPYMTCTPLEILDLALAQRAMPALLATANLDGLHILNKLLPDMPKCLQILGSSLPLPPL
ncbi:MAG: hypothetical protein IJE08_04840 [Clostridia bacterium]|nr:hypothetical protein [Clostridia bacterium]